MPKNRGMLEVYGKTGNFKTSVMIRDIDLMRMTGRVTAHIDKYVKLAGAEKREQVFDLFDKINLLFPHWVIMTCPMMHPDIFYVSHNSQQLFGSNDVNVNERNIEKFFRLVHDDDKTDLHNCFAFIHEFLGEVPSDQHHQYRWIFYYRVQRPNGEHIYIHDEKAVLVLPGSGNLYYALLKDITGEKDFQGVKVEIFKQDNTLQKVKEHRPSAPAKSLSKRESELVTLIKMGLSTKEIAWRLQISANTVRNIKSRMFAKYNVSSSIELLNMTLT